jgi:hypothetical protein
MLARRRPQLGTFVAELHVPVDESVRIELDNGSHGHSTIWCDPQTLLTMVASVERISRCTPVMAYELWDLRSRNLIVDFETSDEAASAVREYIDANEGESLLLVELETAAQPERSLTGEELARWVRTVDGDRRRTA